MSPDAARVDPQTHTARVASNGNEATGGTPPQSWSASSKGRAASKEAQTHRMPAAYAFLALAAETLEDIERVRIAAENRARALTHPEQNIGLPENDPHVTAAKAIASEMGAVEHRAELAVKRMVRETPLGEWVKDTVGVGEKQAGRLLGVIGNPRIRIDGETGEVHERTVGQLWSYCGYAVVPADGHNRNGDHGLTAVGVAPRRRKGEQANWNTKARMRAFLIAESCMKSPSSPYRKLYEEGRAKYEDSAHKAPCSQCGQKGKPAEVGTPLRDGHKHARALRLVAKAVLKDMWIAAD